jgi:hypothetical protein
MSTYKSSGKAGLSRSAPRGKAKVRILTDILHEHPDWRRKEVEQAFHERFPGIRVHAVDFAAARRAVGLTRSSACTDAVGNNATSDPTLADLKKVHEAMQENPAMALHLSSVCELASAVGGIDRLASAMRALRELGCISTQESNAAENARDG